jgi:hypothetical protein
MCETNAVPPKTVSGEPCTIGGAALAAGSSPDAELILLCAQYIALDLESVAHLNDPDCTNTALSRRIEELEAKLTNLPAHTSAGIRAKAEAALHCLAGDADVAEAPSGEGLWLVWSALFDAAGKTAV